ncbi:M23/M56 family metallopeptidase [uncultured Roseivirga sp.]|uniref:M23/M56 family metallopeptidase n=1 Tax=uncultured Roseivirga sp. TaxID=543088 RepID=UPI0030D929EA|tara:strand:+ start:99308 stop:101254 length:1947 start_codon:yes stop_codon:yes gene_type:complete
MIAGLFEIFLCLLVLFGIYKLVLEQTALHRVKRFYLLFALIFSLTTPWLNLEISSDKIMIPTGEMISETLYEVVANEQAISPEAISPSEYTEVKPKTSINYAPWAIGGLYLVIAFVLVVRFGRNIHRLFTKAKNNTRIPYKSAKVVLLGQPTIPHNFLKFIFMYNEDYKKEALREQLLAHELGHALQRHSLDILLVELLQVLFWFNPMYYFYAKAIRLNHEYLADAMVLGKFNDIVTYQRLLLKFANRNQSNEMSLACLSNYSLTKKRFKMMTQQTTKMAALVRAAILLPLLAVTTLCFSLKTKAEAIIGNNANTLISTLENSIFQENKPELHPLGDYKYLRTTSTYGMRKDPVTKEDKMHKGVDFSAKTGTPVIATASGTVEKVESLKGGYGNYIQLKHDDQYQTLYAQLSEMNVQVGDKVEKGQLIGKVGNTGHSTGPHLHYEVIKAGEKVDPKDYYKATPDTPTRPAILLLEQKSRDPKNVAVYAVEEEHYDINLGSGFEYEKVIYDDNKAIFLRKNEEPIIKDMANLSVEQTEALKSLTLPPRSYLGKLQPTQEIVENWSDPTIYGIWIDNKKVDNSVISNYKASDFAHYFKSFLYPNAKKGKIYSYQLNLTTNEKYEKDKIRAAQQKAEWEKTTKASLAKLDF